MALLISILGFYPSYFSVFFKTDAVHHFHGLIATAWMIMLIMQAWFAQHRKFSIHRAMGWLSAAIVLLFLLSGFFVIKTMLQSRGTFSQAFGPRLALVDLISLIYFALCYVLAIVYRKKVRLHSRFLASTSLLVLPPALSRLIPVLFSRLHSFEAAFHYSYFICEFVVALLIMDDRRTGKIQIPYPMLMAVLLVQQFTFMFITRLQWWNAFVTGLRSHAG